MEGALKALLLAALILLVSAQTNYRSLPELYRKHIDKALKEANSKFGAGHHVAFHSLRGTPRTMESNLNVNVLLMVTTCKKAPGNEYKHRDDCDKQKDKTPVIDCLVCKTKDNQELVNCGRRMEVLNGKHDTVRNKCKPVYYTGAANILTHQSLSEDSEKQIGCLGCI